MRIERIISQYRRDFEAVFVCEHCGARTEMAGYDDSYYHERVVPSIPCPSCGKTGEGSEDYRPLTPRYEDWEVV